ncbi:hypothetical protein FE257_000309 [Aspergillus nanangensis]|uniref:Uncharacterized protein n=1 Tax=Aspergillus nanangensis TaxID=2582783 RepID=A0AAD4CZM0_ASPNN|nr:hypothetical protein FE257_000309 [Aspergillus nanangensis]
MPVLNVEQEEAKPSPYQCLNQVLSFPDLDQDEWWHRTAPVLGKMMLDANYDVHRQYQYLVLFAQYVIPLLGLSPSSIGHSNRYRTFLGTFGLPMTSYAGTPDRDPFNRLGLQRLLTSLGQSRIEMNLQLYHQLISSLTLTPTEEQRVLQQHGSLPRLFRTQNIIGLDLTPDGNAVVKLYFRLAAKSLVSGLTTTSLTFDAIRNVDSDGRFTPAMNLIESYMHDQVKPVAMTVEGLCTTHVWISWCACDLVSPGQNRYKIYIHEFWVNLDRAADLWTLGGRIKDCPGNFQGLQILRKLWSLLAIREGSHGPLDAPSGESLIPKTGTLVFNFELHPGDPYPQPKVYLPLRSIIDKSVAEAVTSCFEDFGWMDHARTYTENFSSYYPSCDISQTTELQGVLSFSYSSKNGPYVSVYYRNVGL